MTTVTVVLSFPVSAAKAAQVLERWWAFKEKRKRYMRDRRQAYVLDKRSLGADTPESRR